jgi:hypothetical protein
MDETLTVDIPEASPKPVDIVEPPAEEKAGTKAKKDEGSKKPRRRKAGPDIREMLSPEALAQQILGLHMLAAIFVPEAGQITPDGARMLGEAIYEVASQYDLEWLAHLMPWAKLVVTAAIVEGPIIISIVQKRRAAQAQMRAEAQAAVAEAPSPPAKRRGRKPKVTVVGPPVEVS